ncbi:MAG: PDZ domain-containing protein [Akkermansiaceae bacterium]
MNPIFKKMNIKQIILGATLVAMTSGGLSAQKLPQFVRPEHRGLLTKQAQDFYKVIDPLVANISHSTVVIKANDKIVSLGTVTDKGIVTKYSELSKVSKNADVRMVAKDGTTYPINLLHIYNSYDIAVIENVGKLPAVDLRKSVTPDVGSFIVASSASDQALAMGVVSVKPRSLKEKDRGFLGVVMDMQAMKDGGVLLNHVDAKSAAARAGLMKNDIILTVDGEAVTNILEMRNFLQKQMPGDQITISYKRDGVVSAGVKVTLGAREDIPQVKRSRMNSMKRMGGSVNEISEGFPQVLQSDIQVNSNFCGAPLVDLNGDFVGVMVAKASRIKSYIIEGDKLDDLLKSVPDR